jgi:hypothetical protein
MMDSKPKSSLKEAIVIAVSLLALLFAMTMANGGLKTCPEPSKESAPKN